MKRFVALTLSILLILTLLVGCAPKETSQDAEKPNEDNNAAEKVNGSIILSTTTSTQDSGLLDYLLPKFEEETGIKVKVVAVDTKKALQMGKDGEADILLMISMP